MCVCPRVCVCVHVCVCVCACVWHVMAMMGAGGVRCVCALGAHACACAFAHTHTHTHTRAHTHSHIPSDMVLQKRLCSVSGVSVVSLPPGIVRGTRPAAQLSLSFFLVVYWGCHMHYISFQVSVVCRRLVRCGWCVCVCVYVCVYTAKASTL